MLISDVGQVCGLFPCLTGDIAASSGRGDLVATLWRAHPAVFSLLLCCKQMINTWKIKIIFPASLKNSSMHLKT